VKIAIVGGSGSSTPALFLTPELLALADKLEVTLIGRSESRLRAVRRAIEILTDASIRVETTLDFDRLEGASLVVLQARYGGYEARMRDESFPLRHGICGDEGLGPGGLAAAWRSWPQLSKTLDKIGRRCPRAKVLLMTAPLSVLVRCANLAFREIDVAGICELPWVTLLSACDALRLPVADAQFGYAGINHLGWFDHLSSDSADLIPRYASTRRGARFPSFELITSLKAIPLKYLVLHYERIGTLRRQRTSLARGAELRSIQQRAMQAFLSGGRQQIVAALHARPTPWYSDALGPFIAATAGLHTSTVFFLSRPNDGYLPCFAPDDTLEQPFVVYGGSCRRLARRDECPPGLVQTLRQFVDYERAAAQAVLANRRSACATVLAKHPWTKNCSDMDALASDLIAAV